MVLSDKVIATLNEISSKVQDKSNLSESDTQLIKNAFNQILTSGDRYDVEEIESWFKNQSSWSGLSHNSPNSLPADLDFSTRRALDQNSSDQSHE
jgi:hypothetical protein